MRGDSPADSSIVRRTRWIAAQKAALRGPPVSVIVRGTLRTFVPALLLAICAAGVLVRVCLQDRLPGILTWFYYATPPAVLAAVALSAGLWSLVTHRRLIGLVSMLLTVVCLVWAYRVTWMWNQPAPSAGETKRILFWNVAHGSFGWPRVLAEIRRRAADIVGLVEAAADVDVSGMTKPEIEAARAAEAARMLAFWREQLPEYTVHVSTSGIALLTRSPLESVSEGALGGNYWTSFGHFLDGAMQTNRATMHILVVDIGLDFDRSLWPPLTRLQEILDEMAGRPVVVVGDFNTPTDSVALDGLRIHFANAFESAGNGYAATWPMPVPLITIDQAWASARAPVTRCELGWTWASDHRWIELEVAVTPNEE